MEGGGHDIALANQGWEAFAPGQDLDAGPGLDDARCANEDHLQRTAGERSLDGDDGRVDLATVGVALDRGIEDAEGALGRVKNFLRQQDSSRAGAEDGLFAAEILQGLEETVPVEEAEHGGGFAAGQDEAVQAGQLLRLADLDGICAGLGEGLRVAGEVALDG